MTGRKISPRGDGFYCHFRAFFIVIAGLDPAIQVNKELILNLDIRVKPEYDRKKNKPEG